MNGMRLRLSTAFILFLTAVVANAAEINMRVFQINDHLICFYDGRPPEPATPSTDHNWADFGAFNVGVATYVVYRGDQALVYDTYPSTVQAQWVRDFLVRKGIHHFTVVNSHWHLDHVGGNAVYADVDRVSTEATIAQLTARKQPHDSPRLPGPALSLRALAAARAAPRHEMTAASSTRLPRQRSSKGRR